MNRSTDPDEGSASANVSGHRLIDVFIGWIRFVFQQPGSRHDLSRLAVATLRHIFLHPCLLQRMFAIRGKPFYCGDALRLNRCNVCHARTRWNSIHMNRASAAQSFAASEFCAGKPEHVSQHPKKRSFGICVKRRFLAIHIQLELHVLRLTTKRSNASRFVIRSNIVGSMCNKWGEMVEGRWNAGFQHAKRLLPELKMRA